MIQIIVERLLFTVLLSGIFAGGTVVFIAGSRRYVRSRIAKNRFKGFVDSPNPTLIYFWSANCGQCHPQELQIEKARVEMCRNGKGLAVRKVDALAEKELAKTLHVMTVPTTVLVDADGRLIAWNPGLTKSEKIVDQFVGALQSTQLAQIVPR